VIVTSSVTALAADASAGGGSSPVTEILVALIAAGLLSYVKDAVKAFRARHQARTPEGRDALHVTAADQSLVVVVKARDELEEDNRRLRETLTEDRMRYSEDRSRWDAEKRQMRDEIDSLEAKLRAMLTEVEALKSRHAE
jgi:vacuolar-type H+-ATPase subunit I/STV1